MTLRLEIISRQRQSLRASAIKEFGPDGGTIGRSLQTDWPLPDAQRYLSSQHASIDFRSGSYYIVDTSTNGVYINGATEPVGKGKPQRLFTGDIVRIGEYEMRVAIDTIENTMETLIDSEHVDPVEARQKVDSPDPTGHDLIDAFEITGVGIEMIIDEDEAETLKPLGYSFDTSSLSLEDTAPGRKTSGTGQSAPASAARASAEAATPRASARKARAQAGSPGSSAPTPPPATSGASAAAAPKRGAASAQSNTVAMSAAEAPPAAAPTQRQPQATPSRAAATATSSPAPKQASARAPATAAQKQPAAGKTAPAPPRPGTAEAAPASPPKPAAAKPARAAGAREAAASGAPQRGQAAALIEAFCSGAGVDPATVGDEDPRQVFFRLGQTFSALLAGVTDALRLRSLQKAELRQAQTVIQHGDNNLLKFSANANEALARLLAPQTGDYLDPVESVRDAFADLNAHQRAVLKVLPKVLNQYLQQLDPDELEDKFASAGRNRLIGAANKLRYWGLYRDVYLVMSQQADDELPNAFTEMLAAAFEKEITSIRAASDAAILARKVG